MRSILAFLTVLLFIFPVSAFPESKIEDSNSKEYAEQCMSEISAAGTPYAEYGENEVFMDIVRAMCWLESEWRQFEDGRPYRCSNPGSRYASWGIGQIYDKPSCRYPSIDYRLVKYSMKYNIWACSRILKSKFRDAPRIRKRYGISRRRQDMKIAIMLYNGIKIKDGEISWEYCDRVMEIFKDRPWEKYQKGRLSWKNEK